MKPDSHILQPAYSELGELLFAEVLARFNDRITQEAIIDAEASGSIVETDLAGLEYGIRAVVPTAVNVSSRTLQTAFHEVVSLLRPGLTIEITETHPANLELMASFSLAAHARGAFISLDDVGSGHFADLLLVKTLVSSTRPKWIKLSIDADQKLVNWCRGLNIPIIVERVENSIDLDRSFLHIGAKGVQGWFFDSQKGKAWLHEAHCRTTRPGATKSKELLTPP